MNLRRLANEGAAIVEYVLVTVVIVGVLLAPWPGDGENRNVMRMLRDAMQSEHAGYMYLAGLPALPDGDAWIDGDGSGGGPGGPGGGNSDGPSDPDPGAPGSPGDGSGGNGGPDGGDSGDDGSGGGSDGGGNTGPGDSGGDGGGNGDPSDPDGPGDPDDDGLPGDPDGPGNGSPAHCELDSFDGGGYSPIIGGNFILGASQPAYLASTHVGNPIHVATGNKYQQETDLAPAPGTGLAFQRHYNSHSRHAGAMGDRWRHSYEIRLLDDGTRIRLWQSDGRRIDFRLTHRDRYGHRYFQAAQHGDGTLVAGDFYRWQWRDGGGASFTRSGHLDRLTDAAGRITHFGYDEAGRLATVTDAERRRLVLDYDAQGRIHKLTGPAGHQTRYRYDDWGRLAQVTYADHSRRLYHFEDEHHRYHLTGISVTEADGEAERIATWRYDEQGRAVHSSTAVQEVTLDYQSGRTRVMDADGQTSLYSISAEGGVPHVTAIHGPGCSTCGPGDVRYRYNDAYQVTRIEYRNGVVEVYDYDGLGRLQQVLHQTVDGSSHSVARLAYLGETEKVRMLAVPSVKPGAERTITVHYDADGHPSSSVEAGFAPQPDGSHVAISRRQRFDYGQRGRLIAVEGYRTDVEAMTRIGWASDEAAWEVHFPDGGALRILEHDAHGRPLRIQADDRQPVTLHYDQRGRVGAVSNDRGRLQFDYDTDGGLRSIESRGQERHPHRPVVAPHATVTTEAIGRPTAISDGRGNITHYGFDDFGRKVFTRSPDTGLTVYEHDEAGNLRRKIIASGDEARFDYDAGDRLIAARLADGATEFEWAGAGDASAVATIRAPTGVEAYDYDEAGRITRHVRSIGDQHYTTTYRYDRQGRLSERTLPDGRRLIHRYHRGGPDVGQLRAVLEPRRFGRDRNLIARLDGLGETTTGFMAGNGIRTTWQRSEGRLSGLRIGGMHDFRYLHDAAGRIIGIDDAGRIESRYRFDADGRLDFALTPDTLYGYRYDDNGNRVRQVVNGRHTEYQYAADSNRLLKIGSLPESWFPPLMPGPGAYFAGSAAPGAMRVAADYRPGGEIARLGDMRLHYNANGQIEEVWRGGVRIARYAYNSHAQRIKKFSFDAQGAIADAWHYLYDGQNLVAEAGRDGKIQVQYLYLGHHPVAMLTADAVHAIHTNHLGAPIAVTDEHRNIIWRASYTPFGRATIDTDPDGDGRHLSLNLRLPGQYEDAETGLYYNHHRYYDPDLGRYLTSDPLGLAAGPNTYTYVANDPVNHIDPTGLLLFAFDGTGNSDPPLGAKDISNVVRFRDSYKDQEGLGRPYFYISGPGTDGNRLQRDRDSGSGASLPDRVAEMGRLFFVYIDWLVRLRSKSDFSFDIDVVGFSRGAAAARVFVNLIDRFLAYENGEFTHTGFLLDTYTNRYIDFTTGDAKLARDLMMSQCIVPQLRFLGLFDTVPHYGPGGLLSGPRRQDDDLDQLDLSIPVSVGHVAHAVAIHEDREDFHGVSIHENRRSRNTDRRKELGFIGAHADIGGGYAEGDLSNVAFMWMVHQAGNAANVSMNVGLIADRGWNQANGPAVHDSLGVAPAGYFPLYVYGPGRMFKYTNGIDQVPQREWTGYGLDSATSEVFFDSRYVSICGGGQSASPCKGMDHDNNRTLVGMIHQGAAYSEWLKANYHFDVSVRVDEERVQQEDGRPKPVERTWE